MNKLKVISEQLEAIGIPYEFGEWTKAIQYPYFVGEITEEEPTTEDGLEQSVLFLNGFHRGGAYIDLLEMCQTIKKHFHPVHGLRVETEEGTVVVFYAGSRYVPTNEAELKRIQIDLKIKEWKGEI